ncbi:Asp-tRNA(Asn)/Glu-tRNA(Gln) amidotransferase subunit GatB [Candidatus Pacebacteria bacterium]|nr:Asp-tRNA(Asn)/Glu-tRNA(Gln) amidotransferase subunit GatB [Candidatus Paceibacterota bacterium]
MKSYKTTIGIEIHAELKTKSKMFCGCKNDPHASDPNTNICPVCMAHPGTLPIVNKEAVKKLLVVGHAVDGEIATYTEFDRKNYFYPDIPKAYQISQYEFPFVKAGELAGVQLTRIHLEEDTARSLHDQGEGSLVDFNRAGVPLMELVTEPVIHDPKTAGKFARELQLLLRTLDVSDANMERGEMRVEANISVSDTDELGTKTEVKNLNSFKVMEAAIAHEVKRQIKLLESGEEVVQETRGWDENKGKTFSQRVKENADEYRYFPDPDIPKMDISKVTEFDNSRIREIVPILPAKKRSLYKDLGISEDLIELIVGDMQLEKFFYKVVTTDTFDKSLAKISANYTASDVVSVLSGNLSKSIMDADPMHFVSLMQLLASNEINSRIAKDLLPEILFENVDPRKAAEERGLLQLNSADDLIPLVDEILKEHTAVVDEFKAGKESALKFIIGQAMKASKGSANPEILAQVIKERLS